MTETHNYSDKQMTFDKLLKELDAALLAMHLAKSDMERLQAENARLRKALERILIIAEMKTGAIIKSGLVKLVLAALEGKE